MRLLLAALLILPVACLESDGPADDASDAADGAATSGPEDEPYYACNDPEFGCEADACLERTVDGDTHHVCVIECEDDTDCPPAFAGNAPPACTADGQCVIQCMNEQAAVCPNGTSCIGGDPPACMWPQETPGAGSAAELCQIACGQCNAGMLLDWGEDDCEAVCLDDLQSCDGMQLADVLVCPQDDACSVGGLMFRSCAQASGCIGD